MTTRRVGDLEAALIGAAGYEEGEGGLSGSVTVAR